MFFFFKQKTAYEMRISDWSSDVCSSDLLLLVIILLLGAVGLVVTLLQVKEAWDNVAEKGRIAALAQADRVLFDAVIHIRTDRGNVQSALLGEDDARPTIDKAKATATGQYQ